LRKKKLDDLLSSYFCMQVWLINAGCAQHLVPDIALLTNVRHKKQPFQTALEPSGQATGEVQNR
jgi:hypothetical protein